MRWLILAFISIAFNSYSQTDIRAALLSMVDAEKAFSRMSEQENTNAAFLHYFAPDAIGIIDGKEINARDRLKQQKSDSSLLLWEPVFADIASSADFGYTTGPYRFYKSRKDTTVAGSGYYSSIWQRQADGEWKVLFDLGSAAVEQFPPAFTYTSNLLQQTQKKTDTSTELRKVLSLDREYMKETESNNNTVIPRYFESECRVHRPKQFPLIGKAALENYVEQENKVFKFEQLNGRIASSADMAFTYGNVTVSDSRKSTEPGQLLRYFRIYKKRGNTWRIVFDLIG